jgi:ArsR family transcriptional regulator
MNSMDDWYAVRIAKAFSDQTRFLIYKRIAELPEIRCQDIGPGASVCSSTISHHLRVLSDAGLIESRRVGQAVYYRTAPKILKTYVNALRTPHVSG